MPQLKNKNLVEKNLSFNNDNETVDKIQKRQTRILRAVEVARKAAQDARKNGDINTANELEARADELENWAELKDYNPDAKSENQNSENKSENQNSENKSENQNSENKSENQNSENKSENQNSKNNSENQNSENQNSEKEDEDDEEEFENPFDIKPKHSAKPLEHAKASNKDRQQKQLSEFERMKKALKQLVGGEKAGAAAALNDILKKRLEKKESLHEAFKQLNKDITEVDDAEFEDIINDLIDVVNTVKPVTISTDINSRIEEIKKDNNDILLNRDLEYEDREHTAQERTRLKDSQRELKKYRNSHANDTGAFQNMLRLTIANQVKDIEDEQDSWGAINRRTQGTDIIKPGTIVDAHKKNDLVTIQIYLDCSSSFEKKDIDKELALLSVIDKYVKQGKVAVDLWYFANTLHRTYEPARSQGGTNAWKHIIKNIQETKPTNILIVTDKDMNYDCYSKAQKYACPGCAWYIWKGTTAPELPKHVYGMRGTYEYWLE